jgi:Hemerythrin HHE cation binding domain
MERFMDASTVFANVSPPITKMIRMDHSHVMVTSHKYTIDSPPERKRAIVLAVCLALEIHAQLEEEIFYPALRDVDAGNEVLAKVQPEHNQMRRLIDELRGMEPTQPGYDAAFSGLMREVMHHVADEEAVLLPLAERHLKDRLRALGARMTKRRLQLAAPHAGEITKHTARAMPAGALLVAGGLVAGAYLIGRHRAEHHWH